LTRFAALGYAARVSPANPRIRRVAIVDNDVCDACGLCMPLCPPAAMHMTRHGLVVDGATCTACEKCIAPCPVGALAMVDAGR
jgi:electron transport complex protein RnfB